MRQAARHVFLLACNCASDPRRHMREVPNTKSLSSAWIEGLWILQLQLSKRARCSVVFRAFKGTPCEGKILIAKKAEANGRKSKRIDVDVRDHYLFIFSLKLSQHCLTNISKYRTSCAHGASHPTTRGESPPGCRKSSMLRVLQFGWNGLRLKRKRRFRGLKGAPKHSNESTRN